MTIIPSKKWVWDKIIVLFLFCCVFIVFIVLQNAAFWAKALFISLSVIVGLFWSFPIWTIPIDHIIGIRSKTVIYSSYTSMKDTLFISGYNSIHLKFVDNNHFLFLECPVSLKANSIISFANSSLPETNKKIKINYLKISKVLISWEYC